MAKKWMNSVIVSVFILAAGTASFAAGLEDIQKKYSAYKDFDATFNQSTYQAILNKNIDFTGKILFKRPDGVRMDVYKPQKQIIILKGNKLVVALPDEKTMAVQEVPKEIATQNLLAFIAGISSLDKGYKVKQEKDHFVLTPKNGSGEISIWTDEDSIIKRVKLVDSAGNRSDIRISDYRFNIGLKDNLFETPDMKAQEEGVKSSGN
ncbi:MAG TPA: outer membrane lipoprotein carrier protein LolA [Desulfomonilia bacterium]